MLDCEIPIIALIRVSELFFFIVLSVVEKKYCRLQLNILGKHVIQRLHTTIMF